MQSSTCYFHCWQAFYSIFTISLPVIGLFMPFLLLLLNFGELSKPRSYLSPLDFHVYCMMLYTWHSLFAL